MSVAQRKISAFACLSLGALLAFSVPAFAQTEEVPSNRQPVEITEGQGAHPAQDNAKPSPAVPAGSDAAANSNANTPSSPGTAPSLLDQPSEPAKVDLKAGKLTVRAANSSLSDILRQVSKASGMKIEGLQAGKDQRVFGIYGPGTPRDVLSDLLDGSGYNVMMLGQMPSGVPRQLALTSRTAPGAAPNPPQQAATDNSQDDSQDDSQPTQYPDDQQNNYAPPQGPPEMRNGLRTPQQILQELQRMHQQQQQEQQQQDQQNQQPDDQPQNY